jgi:hypothetical protein
MRTTVDPYQAILQQTIHQVQQRGFRAMSVLGGIDDDGNGAPYTYSIGMRALNHPDVIIPGLPPEVATAFIGKIYGQVKAGLPREVGVTYDDVAEGYPAQFRAVLPAWRDRLTLVAGTVYQRLYGDPGHELIQLFYPDRLGRWPWEADVKPGIRAMQPRLDLEPLPPRFAGDPARRAVLGAIAAA